MNICSARITGAFLCLSMLVSMAACSDDSDTDTPDTGGYSDAGAEPDDDGLVLTGHLAPSGGMSMSSSFTLSGELAPNMPATVSSSASFMLEQTPPTVQGTND